MLDLERLSHGGMSPGRLKTRADDELKITLHSLQGWWENPAVRPGMVLVKDDAVLIRHKKSKIGSIQVTSHGEVRWGHYTGVVHSNGREILWSPGNITWVYIGILPDEYDAETDKGRWRYEAFLGKGSSGCVFAVEEARCLNGETGHRKLAVKVLRSFCDHSKKRNHEDVFKLHQEFQWSRLKLHNRSHKLYNADRSRLIVEYLEDHTGFPSHKKITIFSSDVSAWLSDPNNFSPLPYVVMELDSGTLIWDVLHKREQELTLDEKSKIIQQTAMALDYMSAFNLAHRDLRLHNINVSGIGRDCTVKILDLGRVADKTMPEVFAFSPRDEEHWRARDWIPCEEWVLEGKPKERNGSIASAFDVFSMGAILLYLCVGQVEARQILDNCRKGMCHLAPESAKKMVLDANMVLKMVSKVPTERPAPVEVLNAFANKRRKLD